jgi:hypothetical protein
MKVCKEEVIYNKFYLAKFIKQDYLGKISASESESREVILYNIQNEKKIKN